MDKTQVVMVECFEGCNGWLGRCGIVEVEAADDSAICFELTKFHYKDIREFTGGAIKLHLARNLALEQAPEGMRVFEANLIDVKRIR